MQPRARLIVNLFSDGTSTGIPGDLTGDVQVEFAIRLEIAPALR